MRLIDIDDSRNSYCGECGEYERWNIDPAVLAEAKTEPAQQWIQCRERLPEKDGDYLVCYEEGYRQDYGLDEIGIAPFEVDCEGFGIWQESFDRYTLGSLGSEWVDIPVIAWMPLPESYRGDDNEID